MQESADTPLCVKYEYGLAAASRDIDIRLEKIRIVNTLGENRCQNGKGWETVSTSIVYR